MNNTFFTQGYIRGLLTLALVGIVAALAAYTYLTLKQANGTYEGEMIINVIGEGEVLAKPDIGEFSFGVRAEGQTATEAQTSSAESTNRILAFLSESGVAEKDIKTENYMLNPKYRYEERICAAGRYCPPGEPIIDGYEVNQMISVRVRKLEEAGALISGVGERGATNISGLNFTIDDTDALKAQAREAAIADAKAKAKDLASSLGVRLGKMTGYYENDGQPYPMMNGYGGDRMMSFSESAADAKAEIPAGENRIVSNVTLTYEVR